MIRLSKPKAIPLRPVVGSHGQPLRCSPLGDPRLDQLAALAPSMSVARRLVIQTEDLDDAAFEELITRMKGDAHVEL